jgi:hypothetical protein
LSFAKSLKIFRPPKKKFGKMLVPIGREESVSSDYAGYVLQSETLG